jgi:hypothetical protein
MVGPSHEEAFAAVLVGLTLLARTFGALEVSMRPEDALGAVDRDSLFRHICPFLAGSYIIQLLTFE